MPQVGWQDLIAKIIPVEKRGRFFGITNFLGNGAGILGALAVPFILDSFAFPMGYVISFGNKRVYVAGDTENIPEMKALEDIDIAFLPMNLPYTMTPEMAADAAARFHPRVLYPYHTGETDVARLVSLMKTRKDTEVRIREMK